MPAHGVALCFPHQRDGVPGEFHTHTREKEWTTFHTYRSLSPPITKRDGFPRISWKLRPIFVSREDKTKSKLWWLTTGVKTRPVPSSSLFSRKTFPSALSDCPSIMGKDMPYEQAC